MMVSCCTFPQGRIRQWKTLWYSSVPCVQRKTIDIQDRYFLAIMYRLAEKLLHSLQWSHIIYRAAATLLLLRSTSNCPRPYAVFFSRDMPEHHLMNQERAKRRTLQPKNATEMWLCCKDHQRPSDAAVRQTQNDSVYLNYELQVPTVENPPATKHTSSSTIVPCVSTMHPSPIFSFRILSIITLFYMG